MPEAADPKLSLQLSSPIEEAELTELHDPAEPDAHKVSFAGVETGQATLTVTAVDATIPLGSSISYDLAQLVAIDAMQPETEYVKELDVAILPPDEAAESEQNSDLVTNVVCTVTLQLTYQPSPKDQREELYELLNKTTQRKSKAVEQLRQAAVHASRSQVAVKSNKPAVQSGFLNKSTAKPDNFVMAWYKKNLGPGSLVRRVGPVAKNYIIFFGAVGLMHFQGQAMALPRPV